MSLSSGHGISSGDLNTGGNLSESSFLEALFGLELGHADFADNADDADFFCNSSITHHDFLVEIG